MFENNARAPRVLLGVTGCIAAYKACEVLRGLQCADVEVRVAMTADGARFVGPTTFEALSRHAVATDLYEYPESKIPHIDLSEWADLVLVCPCTGNVMAKAAAGIADDCLTSALLAAGPKKTMFVPAMNVHMWENPATQANVETLVSRGARVLRPAVGRLACGDVGAGKLPAVEEIVAATLAELSCAGAVRNLAGKRIVVTAGPTHEAIDPVRYIANASTGKMGYAIAQAARSHGAEVVLVTGPCSLTPPAGVDVLHTTSAAEMLEATVAAFAHADAAVCAAAVADYTPAHPANHKLKKSHEPLSAIELTETQDILATLSRGKGNRVVVGFAAETDDLIEYARHKLEHKGCDIIVANDVSRPDSAFGSDTDRVTFVTKTGAEELPTLSKTMVAEQIVSRVASMLGRDA